MSAQITATASRPAVSRASRSCSVKAPTIFPTVLVTKRGGITPEQRAVDIAGAHAYSFRGMSPVARAWLNMSLTRRASAIATSRPRRVSR